METREISTSETQKLIHERYTHRMRITKGVSLGELIDMVNTIPKDEKRIKVQRKEDLSVVP